MGWHSAFSWFRAQDLAWLLMFSALAWTLPSPTSAQLETLAGLAILQLVAPRLPVVSTTRGAVAVSALKLLLGFLLIGVTDGVNSPYFMVLLLPVISAATTLGGWATTVFTVLACAAQVAFITLAINIWGYEMTQNEFEEAAVRVIFLPVVGFLTWQLAESNRTEARRAQAAALELARANESLQAVEAAMRRTERLAALGQLTAGLAHELRNPMGTMKASAEMLLKQTGSANPVIQELAGYISSEVDRTNSLITRFLEFARPLQIRPAKADLNELVDQAVTRLERELSRYQVALHKNLAPDLAPLQLDVELMERVIANLVTNAVQASAAGSTVTIKTRPVPGGAELAVIDRGFGILPEHMEQIFNPFFTTKQDGVGLGLPIVSRIVDEHGGKLSVESEPGRGTLFALFLPSSVSDIGTAAVRS